tara:strand:- start:1200 stop:3335 length:2136 start_codon:yes stop_codon:yes gene_type:complete
VKYLFAIYVQIIFSGLLFSQTKPVQGLIKGENDSTLTSVKIISIPSQTKINADKKGEFIFEMPVRDRKLIISHKNHYSDTLDAIIFKNYTKHNLFKVVAEIDTTDPAYLLSLIIDTLTSSKVNNNLKYFDFSFTDSPSYTELNKFIYDNNILSLSSNLDGSNYLYLRGVKNKNHDILYDGIKINNLGNSFVHVNQFPMEALIGMEIVNLGSFQTMPTFGAFNLIPVIKYGFNAKLKQYTRNVNYDNYLGLGSLGFKYASMNGVYSQKSKSIPYQDNDNLQISLLENHNSLNLGIRNSKNLELRVMGFQNKTYFINNKLDDSSRVTFNNLITKVVHKQKDNGKMTLYSLYQKNTSNERFNRILFNKADENLALGFGFEKGYDESLFSIYSESNYIFSDWIIDGINISNLRSNTNFSGSFIIQKPISDKRLYIQNMSLTFNRQNTKDSPDSSMGYFLGNENWEQAGSILNLTFNSNIFNETFILSSIIGNTYQIPMISDRILNQVISPVIAEMVISEESKNFFEFQFIKDFNSLPKKIPIYFELKTFQYIFKNKIKYIYSVGSNTKIPMNIGDAYINGSEVEIKIKSKNKKYTLESFFSVYRKSDIKAFQLQPDLIFKNKITTIFRKVDIVIIHKIESGMQITRMGRNGVFFYDELPLRNNLDISISRKLKFKNLSTLIELSAENLLNDNFQLDGLKLFPSKYLLSFSFDFLN